jgi:esterase FrsA
VNITSLTTILLKEGRVTMPIDIHKIQGPDSSEILYVNCPEKSVKPAVFYFSLSAYDSLSLDPFNTPVRLLSHYDTRIFSFTLPAHGEGLNQNEAMKAWTQVLLQGKDPLASFLEEAAANIRFLIEEGWVDPQNMAVSGLSRGAFAAMKLARLMPELKIILGYAPLVVMSSLDESKTTHYTLFDHIDDFMGKKIKYIMGNNDTRVGTDNAYNFLRALIKKGVENGDRSPPFELTLRPSIGYRGHGTSPESFKEGVLWLAKNLNLKEKLHAT